MVEVRNIYDGRILYGTSRENAVLRSEKYFLDKYSADILLRIHLGEFDNIDFTKKRLVHFNLGNCIGHEVGQNLVYFSIYEGGSFNDGVEVKPVLYDKPSFQGKLVYFKDFVQYKDIPLDLFEDSMINIKNVKELEKIILKRYNYLINDNFTKKDLLARGVAINILEYI